MTHFAPAVKEIPGLEGLPGAYLYPGEVVVPQAPTVVSTILGSCVAVCLWDPIRRHGGVNHYLLPGRGRADASARFAEPALELLLRKLAALGSEPGDLLAKVFGGACVLMKTEPGGRHLGTDNVDAAYDFLAKSSIPVVGAETGGGRGRRLVFRSDEGSAWVKEL